MFLITTFRRIQSSQTPSNQRLTSFQLKIVSSAEIATHPGEKIPTKETKKLCNQPKSLQNQGLRQIE
jgi:hypothetical protein